jgi:hypothetical protein
MLAMQQQMAQQFAAMQQQMAQQMAALEAQMQQVHQLAAVPPPSAAAPIPQQKPELPPQRLQQLQEQPVNSFSNQRVNKQTPRRLHGGELHIVRGFLNATDYGLWRAARRRVPRFGEYKPRPERECFRRGPYGPHNKVRNSPALPAAQHWPARLTLTVPPPLLFVCVCGCPIQRVADEIVKVLLAAGVKDVGPGDLRKMVLVHFDTLKQAISTQDGNPTAITRQRAQCGRVQLLKSKARRRRAVFQRFVEQERVAAALLNQTGSGPATAAADSNCNSEEELTRLPAFAAKLCPSLLGEDGSAPESARSVSFLRGVEAVLREDLYALQSDEDAPDTSEGAPSADRPIVRYAVPFRTAELTEALHQLDDKARNDLNLLGIGRRPPLPAACYVDSVHKPVENKSFVPLQARTATALLADPVFDAVLEREELRKHVPAPAEQDGAIGDAEPDEQQVI